MNEKKSSVLILAAGFSTRMGSPKFALKLPNDQTFLESLVQQYRDFDCDEIVVVLNSEGAEVIEQSKIKEHPELKLVENPTPEKGRFLSIKLGLKSISDQIPVFIQNVDNPFASKQVLKKLRSNLAGFDFVKPVYEGKGGHPVLVGSKMVELIKSEKGSDLNFKEYLGDFNGRSVDIDDRKVLVNINSEEDYQSYLSNQIIA